MNEPETIKIDDVEYTRADKMGYPAKKLDGMEYVIVRSRDAGCFAGYLKERIDNEVNLIEARRLWYWDGAASLSQLAMEGVTKPNECKFPQEVNSIVILGVCEIITTTESARSSIAGVKIWKN